MKFCCKFFFCKGSCFVSCKVFLFCDGFCFVFLFCNFFAKAHLLFFCKVFFFANLLFRKCFRYFLQVFVFGKVMYSLRLFFFCKVFFLIFLLQGVVFFQWILCCFLEVFFLARGFCVFLNWVLCLCVARCIASVSFRKIFFAQGCFFCLLQGVVFFFNGFFF